MPTQPIVDHIHPEYWTQHDHERFEDRIAIEIRSLHSSVDKMNNRLTLLFGGIAVIGFVIPVIAPFIQKILGLP